MFILAGELPGIAELFSSELPEFFEIGLTKYCTICAMCVGKTAVGSGKAGEVQ